MSTRLGLTCRSWNVPIQLSGPVYEALEQVTTLRCLCLNVDQSHIDLAFQFSHHNPAPNNPSPWNPLPPSMANTAVASNASPLTQITDVPAPSKRVSRYNYWDCPRTISGINELRSLDFRDISGLSWLDPMAGRCLSCFA